MSAIPTPSLDAAYNTGIASFVTTNRSAMHRSSAQDWICCFSTPRSAPARAKHAEATLVHMRLERSATGALQLTVVDNGHGLDVPTARLREGSYGLLGMSERARALNGEMRVTGSPGNGTTVEVAIPLVGAVGDLF